MLFAIALNVLGVVGLAVLEKITGGRVGVRKRRPLAQDRLDRAATVPDRWLAPGNRAD